MGAAPCPKDHALAKRSRPGAGGSAAPAVIGSPAVRASRISVPSKTRNLVFVFFSASDLDPKLLTHVSCWDFFVINKFVQLIYIDGAIFSILHSGVDLVYLVSCKHYMY